MVGLDDVADQRLGGYSGGMHIGWIATPLMHWSPAAGGGKVRLATMVR
jgi:hypothetical protein